MLGISHSISDETDFDDKNNNNNIIIEKEINNVISSQIESEKSLSLFSDEDY